MEQMLQELEAKMLLTQLEAKLAGLRAEVATMGAHAKPGTKAKRDFEIVMKGLSRIQDEIVAADLKEAGF